MSRRAADLGGMDLGVTMVGLHDELWILTDDGWYGMGGHRARNQSAIEAVGWWSEKKRADLLARCRTPTREPGQ